MNPAGANADGDPVSDGQRRIEVGRTARILVFAALVVAALFATHQVVADRSEWFCESIGGGSYSPFDGGNCSYGEE